MPEACHFGVRPLGLLAECPFGLQGRGGIDTAQSAGELDFSAGIATNQLWFVRLVSISPLIAWDRRQRHGRELVRI
jgi:hypothetical protein